MKNEKFDRLLSAIRDESVDDKVIAQACERVRNSIAGAPATADLSTRTIRSCADFQVLIPGYLGKQLPPARRLLFDDHVHACVACRHALEIAREGEPQKVWRLETKRSGSRAWWAMGWALLLSSLG